MRYEELREHAEVGKALVDALELGCKVAVGMSEGRVVGISNTDDLIHWVNQQQVKRGDSDG